MNRLSERWEALWRRLGAPEVPAGTLSELVAAYTSPGRFYHTLAHVEDCLEVFDVGRHLADRPSEAELAVWFHDAVYDPRAGDNERKSAEWAGSVIRRAGLSGMVAESVERLILATRHDVEVSGRDAQVLVDVDLSILGREDAAFWEYEQNIRREYAWVPEDLFNRKRAEILRSFLRREHIYQLELYRSMFEARARQNVERAIERLCGASGAA